jgi:DNA-binding PadR family transcriptional regulator
MRLRIFLVPNSTKRYSTSRIMKPTDIPLLGYALMGLIHQKPSSGYDLRKVFAETAMGNYSSSPGAIYPALERLETGRLIRGTVEETGGMRRRKLYYLSPRGLTELKSWLLLPVGSSDVLRGSGDLMLRFSFMDRVLGPSACIAFLESFRKAIAGYLPELESFLAGHAEFMTLSSRLALESGIRGYQSLYDWTAYALREYRSASSKARTTKSTAGGSK